MFSINKRIVFIFILLLITLIGCSSSDSELMNTQIQAYNDELAFCQNALKVIDKYYSDISEYETTSSSTAAREIWVQFDLIEQRYSSSDFNNVVPCEDATMFINNMLEASIFGKSAIDSLNKFYSQDRSSSSWSSAEWKSFTADISDAYSYFTYASTNLESIRSILESGQPIK
jgi:hypothetical protein